MHIMNRYFFTLLTLIVAMTVLGCRQPVANPPSGQSLFNFNRPNSLATNNPFGGAFGNRPSNNVPNLDIQTNSPQQYQAFSNLSNQLNDLNQRVGAFDADNQQLHSEIAGLQQKLQLANDYNQQLRQQLADSSGQLRQLFNEKTEVERQLALNRANPQNQFAQFNGGQAPTQLPGTATVRANNSLLQKLDQIRIPGGDVRMDGDVIRIEFPSDSLFVPGTYQIQASQVAMLQNLVTTIRQHFPKQIVGVEAHWDGTPLSPAGTTDHQLTATQSLAVFNELRRQGLDARQMFTMALGSNRPRHANAQRGTIHPNRRVDIVIYPEQY